jgi:transcription elongation factor Elf1
VTHPLPSSIRITEGAAKLLPCPFCGGKAERYTASVGVGFENRQVQCRQCGASAFDAKWQVRKLGSLQVAWDAVDTLPSINFSDDEEAEILAALSTGDDA